MAKKFLISIVGPTAIGKTSLSLVLAEHFGTEIISADSRQFYREMKIGTAVPTEEELHRAQHHFIQHISIEEQYSVGNFERDALQLLKILFLKKDILIIVGGSGLYVDAVIKGLDRFPEVDPKIREDLNQKFSSEGIEALQDELKILDPGYFSEVDQQNPHRLIRALEICRGTGKSYSSFRKSKNQHRNFESIYIGLTADRQEIYDRINLRVELMMEEGLLDEAKMLYDRKDLNALNTVGYKELFNYFEGHWDLNTAVEEIKKNTRRFAKRQLTWFRRNKEINWFDYKTEPAKIIYFLEEQMSTRSK